MSILTPGTAVFTRSPGGNAWTGRVVRVDRDLHAVVLTDAAWIASTGRFHQWMAGEMTQQTEIEPLPDGMEVTVPLAYTEISEWPYPLPREAR